jgi:hypothetical protein
MSGPKNETEAAESTSEILREALRPQHQDRRKIMDILGNRAIELLVVRGKSKAEVHSAT